MRIAGIEHGAVEVAVFAVGWALGWLLLWSPRQLPSSHVAERATVAVVIPARDEEASIAQLVRPLVDQRRPGDRIVVVDDHSTDATGRIARELGAEVLVPPELPAGWAGKSHACWHGASAVEADVLVFVDADVRPSPTLLDDLAAQVAAHPGAIVSVQPWHRMETASEQPSALVNVVALMGCAAFGPWGHRPSTSAAFGPVVALDRSAYLRSGGHAAAEVRAAHVEDVALARNVGRSMLHVGSPDSTTFRMYPRGVPQLVEGWTRSIAAGASSTPWWVALATVAWVASLAGGWIAAPLVYPVSAIQVWVLGRRAGSVRWWAAAAYPLLVAALVVVVASSAVALVLGRDVTWKGRRVGTRSR
ncbi:glycosyltransferase [Ilumatobacter sp.]|uniref:glycosyltransferase n=1 Tax=Ilumatobacter sp. TaxID=1967498 RepID=UPI003B51DF0A